MTAGAKTSPLLGFNSNLRYRGCVFHLQTEDSGRDRPRVTTHLFVNGGQIVASRRSEYGALLADPDLNVKLKQQMQEQHRALLIELKNGLLDDKIESVMGRLEPKPTADSGSSPRAADVEIYGGHSLVDPLRSVASIPPVASIRPPAVASGEGPSRRAPAPPMRHRQAPTTQNPQSTPAPPSSVSFAAPVDETSASDVILSFISQELE